VSHLVADSDRNETGLFNDYEPDAEFEPELEPEADFLGAPVSVNVVALTLITESKDYHRGIFLLKCLSTPFVIGALLLFCVRMYLNDLYISIPDRLLIAVALAQGQIL
jgi:hypothetical protein